jgi:hypothetical protein
MDHYNVEYGGFLSNHLAHGVIAFERMGAGDDRIEQFANEYKEKYVRHETLKSLLPHYIAL